MNENVSDGSQASQAAAQPHSPLALLEQVDPISFAVVRLHTAFNDVQLGPATGFFHSGFIDNRPAHWLITNWHVLSGRNADDPLRTLHSQGALPNRLRLSLVLRADQPEYAGHRNEILMQEQTMELYDAEGKAIWYQHPRKNAIDVAVINVGRLLSDRYQATCITKWQPKMTWQFK